MSDELTAMLHGRVPIAVTLGITAVEAGPGGVVLRLPWSEPICTEGGRISGGVLMTLADAAGGICAFFNLPENAVGTTAIESKTNFIGAVTEGEVTATARPLHVGSSTMVVEIELHHDGHLVAKVIQTQIIKT